MKISYILIGCCIAGMFVCGHARHHDGEGGCGLYIDNGFFSLQDTQDTQSTQEDTYTLICDEGYEVDEDKDKTTTCQEAGFETEEFLCKKKVCSSVFPPDNGKVSAPSITYNDVAEFSCDTGFYLFGVSTLTCLSSKEWSDPDPVCLENKVYLRASGVFTPCVASTGFDLGDTKCPSLSHPVNGQVSDFATIAAKYLDTATYSCNNGYNLHGATTIHCQADGTWNPPISFCGNNACPSLSNPINGKVTFVSSTSTQETVSYSCNIDYNLVGDSIQSCPLADGAWSGNAPACQKKDAANGEVAPISGGSSASGKLVVTDGNVAPAKVATVEPLGKLAPNGDSLSVKPFSPWKPCQHPCCVQGEMNIGLGSLYDDVRGSLAGVTVLQTPMSQSGANANKPCSKTALLKVNFEKITKEYCGEFCLENPYCGRRMLKIDMDLSADERSSWMFNVGDSISNNGWKGDSGHQSNDAETDGRYPNVAVWSSDVSKKHQSLLAVFFNAIGPIVDHVTLYVSNEHIRITNNAGLDKTVCHRWLYALNGHPDIGPINTGPNEDIYIGLNRVVNGLFIRNGFGLCSATLTWTCPWN